MEGDGSIVFFLRCIVRARTHIPKHMKRMRIAAQARKIPSGGLFCAGTVDD